MTERERLDSAYFVRADSAASGRVTGYSVWRDDGQRQED